MLAGGKGEDWVRVHEGGPGPDRPPDVIKCSAPLGDISSPEYHRLSPFHGFKRLRPHDYSHQVAWIEIRIA